MADPKKTHVERKHPQISLARLADFMAASEQTKRSIATSCKYQPIARVIQYNDAKAIISNYIKAENRILQDLKQKHEVLQNKICDSSFEADVKSHNCDCVARFIALHDDFDFKDFDYTRATKFDKISLNGMLVNVQADVLVSRMSRTNKKKIGALMLRYSKGKPVAAKAALHQSAFMYEFFRQPQFEEIGGAEKSLCITLDIHSATSHEAPGNSTYLFKEMAATCANLAERWPVIKPPASAVL